MFKEGSSTRMGTITAEQRKILAQTKTIQQLPLIKTPKSTRDTPAIPGSNSPFQSSPANTSQEAEMNYTTNDLRLIKRRTDQPVFREEDERDVDPLISFYHISKKDPVLYNKDLKKIMVQKYNIKNDLNHSEKQTIKQILSHSASGHKNILSNWDKENKLKPAFNINEEYFKSPYKALKKIKMNKQIHECVNSIRMIQLHQKFNTEIEKSTSLEEKIRKMPQVKVITNSSKEESPVVKLIQHQSHIKIDFTEEPQLKKELSNVKHVEEEEEEEVRMLSRDTLIKNGLHLQGRVICFLANKPKARNWASCILDEDQLWVFGGLNGLFGLDDLWNCQLKLNNPSWTQMKPLSKGSPIGRYGHSCVQFRKALFIFGGCLNEPVYLNNDFIIIYDIKENRYHFKKSGNQSEVLWRRNHLCELVNSQMIIYGGLTEKEEVLNDISFLELTTFKWNKVNTKSEFPALAHHASALVLAGEKKSHPKMHIYKYPELPHNKPALRIKVEGIFVFGGYNEDRVINNDMHVIKIGRNPVEMLTIKQKGAIPCKRYSASLTFYEKLNVLFLFGGRDHTQVFCDLYMFEIEIATWFNVFLFDHSPSPRAEHNAVVFENKLIIFGGMEDSMYSGADFFVVHLDSSEKKRVRYNK